MKSAWHASRFASYNIEAKHPDDFVIDTIDLSPSAVAKVIAEGKSVTYDLKTDRNDPSAVGTQEMAEAICKAM